MAQTKLYTKVSNESDDEEDNKEPQSSTINKRHTTRNGVLSLLINPKFTIFTLCLLASIIFIFYWFINEDITFVVCGIIGLLMCLFALFIFRMSLEYKQKMQLYKSLNRAVKMDYKRCNAQIDRTRQAIKILQETKQRLIKNNATNKNNYKIFERMTELIQENGNKNNIYNNSVSMAQTWKKQNIENVKETLLKVYDRFLNDIIGDGNATIIKQEQITEFEQMLPIELREKFAIIDIFNELCVNGNDAVNSQQFVQYLHKFATLEVDMAKPIRKTHKTKSKKTVVSSTKISGQTPSTAHNKNDALHQDKYHKKAKTVDDKNDEKSNDKTDDKNQKKKSDDSQIAMDYNDEKVSESGVLIPPQTKSESQLSSSPPVIVVVDNASNSHKNNENTKDKTETVSLMDDKKSTETNTNNETNLSLFDEEEYQQSAKRPSPIITVESVDVDKSSGTNNEQQRRKVGKLKHKWGQGYKDEKGKYTPKSKKVKEDTSWVTQKNKKPIHPVHESIDALQIDKLVTKAQIVKKLSVTHEDEEDNEFQFDLPKQKSKTGICLFRLIFV